MPSQRCKRHLATWGASVACLLIGASAALAQDKTFDLKLSHWVPPSHPLQKAMEEWGFRLDAAGLHQSRKVIGRTEHDKAAYRVARDAAIPSKDNCGVPQEWWK